MATFGDRWRQIKHRWNGGGIGGGLDDECPSFKLDWPFYLFFYRKYLDRRQQFWKWVCVLLGIFLVFYLVHSKVVGCSECLELQSGMAQTQCGKVVYSKSGGGKLWFVLRGRVLENPVVAQVFDDEKTKRRVMRVNYTDPFTNTFVPRSKLSVAETTCLMTQIREFFSIN